MDKKTLRQTGRAKARETKEQHGPAYDKQIAELFFGSQSFMPRSVVAAFMALKGEVGCEGIIRQLGKMGHLTCLPVIIRPGEPMIFREFSLGDSTRPGLMGQLEPLDDAPEIIPDVLLVPMLGFSRTGYRLGYGTGFYDRTLPGLREMKSIKVIGLAYNAQEVPDFKHEEHDEKMDMIITEKEVIKIK
jgi:5-formyltetrahydrofolate cyclo-ligase